MKVKLPVWNYANFTKKKQEKQFKKQLINLNFYGSFFKSLWKYLKHSLH